MSNDLKRLELTQNSFEANGRKYIIHPSLSVKRFEEFEKMQIEVSWGVDFDTLFKKLKEVWEKLDKGKFAEASVVVWNLLKGISRLIEQREHPLLLLCTLFICLEDEDRRDWDEATAKEKIQDWREEGIIVSDFFGLAFNLVQGFTDGYKQSLNHFSSLGKLEPKKRQPSRSK